MNYFFKILFLKFSTNNIYYFRIVASGKLFNSKIYRGRELSIIGLFMSYQKSKERNKSLPKYYYHNYHQLSILKYYLANTEKKTNNRIFIFSKKKQNFYTHMY